MKKLLALLLCLTMLVCLVACGGTEEKKKTDKESEESVSAEPSGSEESPSGGEAVSNEPSGSEETPSGEEEEHDHNHISFNDQEQVFTVEQMPSIVGREHDFTYDQNGKTIYIYNDLTVGTLTFSQAQFTFNEDHNRISCTHTVDKGSEEAPRDAAEIESEVLSVMESYEDAMVALYGKGTVSEQHGATLISWTDHTGNYIILTQINDTTVQLAYYIYAK